MTENRRCTHRAHADFHELIFTFFLRECLTLKVRNLRKIIIERRLPTRLEFGIHHLATFDEEFRTIVSEEVRFQF
jgi:hypothetical protein